MRISDWSSDVCSSDLCRASRRQLVAGLGRLAGGPCGRANPCPIESGRRTLPTHRGGPGKVCVGKGGIGRIAVMNHVCRDNAARQGRANMWVGGASTVYRGISLLRRKQLVAKELMLP